MMRKLLFYIISVIKVSCAVSQTVPISDIYKYAADSIYEDYRQGYDNSASIGLLKNILTAHTVKDQFLKLYPDLKEIKVTGTAAPFKQRVEFEKWVALLSPFNYVNHTMNYRYDERSDGMISEVLTIEQKKPFVKGEKYSYRVIWIYRFNKSIISIWDSDLN